MFVIISEKLTLDKYVSRGILEMILNYFYVT
jgi:hypothetical protein